MSERQVQILDHLDEVEPLSLTELSQHLGVTPAMTSLAIDRLQARGYVTRAIDTKDRRRVLLRLTPAGARVCEAQKVLEPALVYAMLATLNADDRAVAIRGLHLLAQGALTASQRRGPARMTQPGRVPHIVRLSTSDPVANVGEEAR